MAQDGKVLGRAVEYYPTIFTDIQIIYPKVRRSECSSGPHASIHISEAL